jgi:uncharacterized membrane protein HdeD (DUF308 family)
MKMRKFGINFVNLIFGIVMVALGIWFCSGDTEVLTRVIFIVLGVVMIASNITPLVYAVRDKNLLEIIYRSILVIFGIVFMFWHNTAILIIVGILFILLPCLTIVLSDNKRDELMIQLPSIILGVVIIVLGPATIGKVIFIILGVISIVFGVLAIASSFYKQSIIKSNE